MALCLANSLVARRDYVPYDQLVRYLWWHRHGYMSSTGTCFDIGAATKKSLAKFERRQKKFAAENKIFDKQLDALSDPELLKKFKVNCSEEHVAGNGALMRLAPVPLFFYQHPTYAVKYSGQSGELTHGDPKAYDACRYYGALIVAAVEGTSKDELLDDNFYDKKRHWFTDKPLHPDIEKIARGSYKKKGGYADCIKGNGYIVNALEAALWAFWSDKNSFKEGVLAAVNLGDDTDTTAAIYGQLAGAYYGYKNLPKPWTEQVYAKDFIAHLSRWIVYEGMRWSPNGSNTLNVSSVTSESPSKDDDASSLKHKTHLFDQQWSDKNRNNKLQSSTNESHILSGSSSILKPFAEVPEPRTRSRTFNNASETLELPSHGQYGYGRPKSADRHSKQ
jgi:ADP-ribosyl-[dinitrogen reductase] hydrolase